MTILPPIIIGLVLWFANLSIYIKDVLLQSISCSVTRLGDLLNFGQPFKVFGNNFYRNLAIFYLVTLISWHVYLLLTFLNTIVGTWILRTVCTSIIATWIRGVQPSCMYLRQMFDVPRQFAKIIDKQHCRAEIGWILIEKQRLSQGKAHPLYIIFTLIKSFFNNFRCKLKTRIRKCSKWPSIRSSSSSLRLFTTA